MRVIAIALTIFSGGFFVHVGSRVLGGIYGFEPLKYWEAFQVFNIVLILFTCMALVFGMLIGD